MTGALAETVADRTAYATISAARLRSWFVTTIAASRSLSLVDLTGAGLRRVGADSRLTSGDHDVAQVWSRAFHDHPDQPDGILYRARSNPSCVSVALFERAKVHLTFGLPAALVSHPELRRVIDEYELAIVE